MVKIAVAAVVAVVAAVLLFAATRPDTFRVQRSQAVKAPAEKVYPLINDLAAWQKWSPWEAKDPQMKRTLSGPQAGKGAAIEWQGNKEVGKGRMEIAESTAPSKVVFDLTFVEPFPARNVAEFTLASKGDTTTVSWSMYGPQPYFMKVMGLFIDCDAMIGRDFEAGLAKLAAVAEQSAVAGK